MKKSVTIRVLCLVIAALVLGASVAYAAVSGSPYETLKNAVLDAMTARNVTVEAGGTLTVNGVVQPGSDNKTVNINGDDSTLTYTYDANGNSTGYIYNTNGLYINSNFYNSDLYTTQDGAKWYSASVNPPSPNFANQGFSSFSTFTPEDRNSSAMRFYTLALDALVGDLKNNVTMSTSGGIRHISGTLTGSQVPALAKAGLDMLVEQSGNYSSLPDHEVSFDGTTYVAESIQIDRSTGTKTVTPYTQTVRAMTPEEETAYQSGTFDYGDQNYYGFVTIDNTNYICTSQQVWGSGVTSPVTAADFAGVEPLNIPMKSLTIEYVHGNADVDKDGNLLNLKVNGTATITDILGDTKTVEINYTVTFSDIGTSNAACPIPGAEQLLTAENMKARFGSDTVSVYFTLNTDGSINADSVTTTYPGQNAATFGATTFTRTSNPDGSYDWSSVVAAPSAAPTPGE